MQQCIQLTRVLYPNATILVGEILPHPNNESMNNGVRNVNYFLQEEYPNLKGRVRFVEHPIRRVDNELYDDDGVHLNNSLGIPQLLKYFSSVMRGRKPFSHRK